MLTFMALLPFFLAHILPLWQTYTEMLREMPLNFAEDYQPLETHSCKLKPKALYYDLIITSQNNYQIKKDQMELSSQKPLTVFENDN